VIDDKMFSTPAEHMVRLLQGQINENSRQIADLKKQLSNQIVTAPVKQTMQEAGFITDGGKVLTLEKHRKRVFADTKDRDTAVKRVIDRLTTAGIDASNENLKKMGLGRGTITNYKNKKDVLRKKGTQEKLEQNTKMPQ
jgi:hypothetical protein